MSRKPRYDGPDLFTHLEESEGQIRPRARVKLPKGSACKSDHAAPTPQSTNGTIVLSSDKPGTFKEQLKAAQEQHKVKVMKVHLANGPATIVCHPNTPVPGTPITNSPTATKTSRGVTALVPWFGGNRMLASHVGTALAGCKWVGVVFAGGMSELPHIDARTIVVNDQHRHVINLARVVASDVLRPTLVRRLRRKVFHPDELKGAQQKCKDHLPEREPDINLAEAYFISSWIGRSSKAGIHDEFNGRPAIRWKADGGDSMVRYQSALRMLVPFSRTLRRCTFETMDGLDFLGRCEDTPGNGVYCDPPFPVAGRRYRHNAGQTSAEERDWHTRLRDSLLRFQASRVVCRFYEHPLIRELYPETQWQWQALEGRKQSNDVAAEVLIVRNQHK